MDFEIVLFFSHISGPPITLGKNGSNAFEISHEAEFQ